ncbi:MAG: protein kinase [Armatimonadetes bacterium]|nr:protein kinase [Armatimonadota bacterium]
MSQTTLGKYQIIREIARSNDIVYEAYDPVMNRRVAVKELAMPGGATQQQRDDRIQRFLREARAAGSLVHPNIVTIYEVGEEAGRRYIAMEYLDGQNLRNLLDTKGFIEPAKAVGYAVEVLKGLEFAHSKGVIHRDVKPDNIQLLENGEVKITDFGIARLTFEPNLTMDGQVFGTPSYMSPEQINGRDIDARSDLFSVGVILYEMVAGQKPFSGDNVVAITHAIMNVDPPQPGQCGPGLWNVVRQAIEKSPQLRWSSAREMADALKSVLAQMASGQVVVDPYVPAAALPPAYPTLGPVNPGPPPVQIPVYQPQASPYGPGLTPYGTPMPGTVQQPYLPSQYGQPYGAPSYPPQMGGMGQPYGQQMPMAQVPVYYPPAVRPPMFSPETRVFFGRLLKVFLLLGTISALVVAAVIQGPKILAPKATFKPRSAAPGAAETVGDRDRPGSQVPLDTANGGSRTSATVESARATVELAVNEPNPDVRQRLIAQASTMWSDLALEGDKDKVFDEAFESFVSAAQSAEQKGDPNLAAQMLVSAGGYAHTQQQSDRVNEAMARLGR